MGKSQSRDNSSIGQKINRKLIKQLTTYTYIGPKSRSFVFAIVPSLSLHISLIRPMAAYQASGLVRLPASASLLWLLDGVRRGIARQPVLSAEFFSLILFSLFFFLFL